MADSVPVLLRRGIPKSMALIMKRSSLLSRALRRCTSSLLLPPPMTGMSLDDIAHLKAALSATFTMTDAGEASRYLGLRLLRHRDKHFLTIDLEDYLVGVLRRFGMLGCNPVSTPFPPSLSLVRSEL